LLRYREETGVFLNSKVPKKTPVIIWPCLDAAVHFAIPRVGRSGYFNVEKVLRRATAIARIAQ
jgi:hypothetical protein